MNLGKTLVDLRDALAVLEDNICLFHGGRTHAYRVVAVELRKLVCDGSNSVLPRIWGKIRLHPLPGIGTPMDDSLVFQMPALVQCYGDGRYRVLSVFDERVQPIELDQWLDQPLLNKQITIRNLIRSAADKEGAHSDKDYNDTLRLAHSMFMVTHPMHFGLIVAIGEYVLRIVRPHHDKLEAQLRAQAPVGETGAPASKS